MITSKSVNHLLQWFGVLAIMLGLSAAILCLLCGALYILQTPLLLIGYLVLVLCTFEAYGTVIEPIETQLTALCLVAPMVCGLATSLRNLTVAGILVWLALGMLFVGVCIIATEKPLFSKN